MKGKISRARKAKHEKLMSRLDNAKDFTRQDIKKRADRIGKGELKHDWFLIAFIIIIAMLGAGALSGLIPLR